MTRSTHDVPARANSEGFWDQHYQNTIRPWSGEANYVLVDMVEHSPPGRALDLGCGEGGDAVWLAMRGWRVTAVDVSATVLDRVRQLAAASGVGDWVIAERHDLARTFPNGAFDLVTALFLHSPLDFQREQVLRQSARAVAPGGMLLIVDHGSVAPWSWNQDADPHFPSPEDILASLDLEPESWSAERLESLEREAVGPGGQAAIVIDTVVAVRRIPD